MVGKLETEEKRKADAVHILYAWYYAGLSQAGGRGGGHMPPPTPPLFDRSVNPVSTRGRHIIPTQYYVPSRIFRPCDGPAMYSIKPIPLRWK